MSEAVDRRTVILEHAAGLFATKGIVGTSVREIADAVGILSGSLYHHFQSKDEMVSAIVRDYLADLTGRYTDVLDAGSDPRTQLAELVRASLATTEAHPHATEIYQNSANYLRTLGEYEEIRQGAGKIQTAWLTVLQAGVDSGEFRSDIPLKVLYRLLRDALWMSVRWFQPTTGYSRARFADDFVSTFLEGVLTRPTAG
jgi:AcrR family transcriptional regulator